MQIMTLLPILLLGAALALPASALAQVHPSDTMTITCKVEEVATFFNRVHVGCSKTGWLRFFASPTSNAGEATRLATLGSAALMRGGELVIVYEPFNYDAESYGCVAANCRRPYAITLK